MARAGVSLDAALSALPGAERLGGLGGSASLRQYVLASFAWCAVAPATLAPVFSARAPAWRCVDPAGCPSGAESMCDLPRAAWEFSASPADSVCASFGVVCGRAYLVGVGNSCFFGGFLVGCNVFGRMADTQGRRPVLVTTLLGAGAALFAQAAATSMEVWIALRLVTGFFCAGVGIACFTLALEHVGSRARGSAGTATQYFWATGLLLLPALALMFPGWRAFTVASGVSSVVGALAARAAYESPRWLLNNEGPEKARAVLTAWARSSAGDEAAAEVPPLAADEPADTPKETLLSLLPHPALCRRLGAMMVVWFACSAVYYGLALGVGSLSGDLYMNGVVSALVEFPAYLVAQLTVDRLGRKWLESITLFVAGSACMLCGFVDGDARTGIAMVGRFSIAISFNLVFTYTTELFPTSVRSSAIGATSSAARLGGIGAPAVLVLNTLSASLPFIVFGGIALGGAAAAFTLPETLGVPLSETVADAARESALPKPARRVRRASSGGDFHRLEDGEEQRAEGAEGALGGEGAC